jgi:hypothetical protein
MSAMKLETHCPRRTRDALLRLLLGQVNVT